MYKRQHYALEHTGRDSASSDSSSSLDTVSDADSDSPEQVDGAAWPASSHESDEISQEEVVEVESSASVAARRTEAIRIAERKLAEAAEDLGEFKDELEKAGEAVDNSDKPGDGAEGSDEAEGKPEALIYVKKRTSLHGANNDGISSDEELGEALLTQRKVSNQWAEAVNEDALDSKLDSFDGNTVICVGGENMVFKCRVCPKVVCLNEGSMRTHLVSKRHSRSLKQLAEGRLKIQLDSDGDEDEDGETHAERYARTVEAAQEVKEKAKKRKRDSGRQRQRNREKLKKTVEKPGIGLPRITGENRKERRAHQHGGVSAVKSSESKSRTKKPTSRKQGKKLSEVVVNRELNVKKKRPRQAKN